MSKTKNSFSPAERRNWGYWDGRAAKAKGKYPEWSKGHAGVENLLKVGS